MLKIQQSSEDLNSNGGIALAGNLLGGLRNLGKLDRTKMGKVRKGQISHSEILKSAAGLFVLGRSDFADIEQFREDQLFRDSLGLRRVPSEETLRQRLDGISSVNGEQTLLDDAVVELLSKVEGFGGEETSHGSYIPLDIDVSVQDNSGSRKEEVSWTYKNVDGYAPIFAYLGTEGYMLANELRNGSQHSAKGAVEFVERCLDMAGQLELDPETILVRVDSGHDDQKFISALLKRNVKFLIKRNLRRESPEQYLAMAKRLGEKQQTRDGKNVYRCILSHIKPASLEDEPLFVIVEATERLTDRDGQPLLLPDLEVSTWWTNLSEYETDCIRLYHNHATSEQFHSELKSDMGIERLPSGKFATNALILNLAALSYNCLRILGQRALRMKELLPRKLKVARRRLRSVMQDLIHIACKIVSHGNRKYLKFGRNCPWFKVFKKLYTTS
jgi:hypothetical protein